MRLPVLLAAFCGTACAQCTISGAIVDSETARPVERARVVVTGAAFSLPRLTDAAGKFCFDKLGAGEYHLFAQKPGYSSYSYPVTLSLEPESPVGPLTVRLTQYGSLTGTVLDNAGEPVPGASVTVWQRTKSGPGEVDDAIADANGVFHFSGLPPANYYLSAKEEDPQNVREVLNLADDRGAPTREREVATFYPSSLSFVGATPLRVKAGEPTNNVAISLRKVRLRRITGRLADAPGDAFLAYQGTDGDGAIPIGRDGFFAKFNLLPAKYTLDLFSGGKVVARSEVDLTLNDALNIALQPLEVADVSVVIRTEGKGPAFQPGGRPEFVLQDKSSEDVAALQSSGDGKLRFSQVAAGLYRLRTDLKNRKLYLKSIAYGGQPQNAGRIDLRNIHQGELEITLSPNVAEVQGKVSLPGDTTNDLTVILVDGDRMVQQAGTDQHGRFGISALPPGNYRLFAIEGFDEDNWGSPELRKALESKSVELDLKENEKKQVSLTAISAGEWDAAVRKAGG